MKTAKIKASFMVYLVMLLSIYTSFVFAAHGGPHTTQSAQQNPWDSIKNNQVLADKAVSQIMDQETYEKGGFDVKGSTIYLDGSPINVQNLQLPTDKKLIEIDTSTNELIFNLPNAKHPIRLDRKTADRENNHIYQTTLANDRIVFGGRGMLNLRNGGQITKLTKTRDFSLELNPSGEIQKIRLVQDKTANDEFSSFRINGREVITGNQGEISYDNSGDYSAGILAGTKKNVRGQGYLSYQGNGYVKDQNTGRIIQGDAEIFDVANFLEADLESGSSFFDERGIEYGALYNQLSIINETKHAKGVKDFRDAISITNGFKGNGRYHLRFGDSYISSGYGFLSIPDFDILSPDINTKEFDGYIKLGDDQIIFNRGVQKVLSSKKKEEIKETVKKFDIELEAVPSKPDLGPQPEPKPVPPKCGNLLIDEKEDCDPPSSLCKTEDIEVNGIVTTYASYCTNQCKCPSLTKSTSVIELTATASSKQPALDGLTAKKTKFKELLDKKGRGEMQAGDYDELYELMFEEKLAVNNPDGSTTVATIGGATITKKPEGPTILTGSPDTTPIGSVGKGLNTLPKSKEEIEERLEEIKKTLAMRKANILKSQSEEQRAQLLRQAEVLGEKALSSSDVNEIENTLSEIKKMEEEIKKLGKVADEQKRIIEENKLRTKGEQLLYNLTKKTKDGNGGGSYLILIAMLLLMLSQISKGR